MPPSTVPPAASKLDEYLEDYLKESGQELKSKSSTPEPFRGSNSNGKYLNFEILHNFFFILGHTNLWNSSSDFQTKKVRGEGEIIL